MSNKKNKISPYERLWRLQTKINMMVSDGVRDSEKVADLLQTIVNMKVHIKRLFSEEVISFGDVEVAVYELSKNATFQEMFSDLREKRRCWKNKEGALAFSRANPEKLGPNGNFFELEGGLVASVRLGGDGQLYLEGVSPFSFSYTWIAGYQHHMFYLQQ